MTVYIQPPASSLPYSVVQWKCVFDYVTFFTLLEIASENNEEKSDFFMKLMFMLINKFLCDFNATLHKV